MAYTKEKILSLWDLIKFALKFRFNLKDMRTYAEAERRKLNREIIGIYADEIRKRRSKNGSQKNID